MAGLVHGPETRPDVAQKQNRNYHSVVRTVPGNFLITYTVHAYMHNYNHMYELLSFKL